MKRVHIPQISNQTWFPSFLRQHIHEFMTWFVGKVGAAKPFMPIIEEGLQYADQIIEIEQTVGAGFETIIPYLDAAVPIKTVGLKGFSVNQKGLYISVNAFHQLRETEAQYLLEEIAKSRNPVAIVEGNNDSLWQVFGMTIIVPLTVLLTAPFVKPFRFSRLILTYLIPILPIVTFIDGAIALTRLYATSDLDELSGSIKESNYTWRSGKLDNGRGGKIIYLLGYPEEEHEAVSSKSFSTKNRAQI